MHIQDDRALARLVREDMLLDGTITLVDALRALGCDCPVDDIVRHAGIHAERCKGTAKDAQIAALERE